MAKLLASKDSNDTAAEANAKEVAIHMSMAREVAGRCSDLVESHDLATTDDDAVTSEQREHTCHDAAQEIRDEFDHVRKA
jgi:hypothetical protein